MLPTVPGAVTCPGCGATVAELDDFADDDFMIWRDPAGSETAGRATILIGGAEAHRCAPGTFVPPDEIASPGPQA